MYGRSADAMSMNSSPPGSIRRDPFLKTVIWGFLAGLLGGLTMLLTMALLRLVLGWPTPTELIFDRLFPLLTVEFFIGSLVKAGGYTPLKLQGIYGALTGQLIVAAIGGVIYSIYLRRKAHDPAQRDGAIFDRRGLLLIVPGVGAATVLFVALLSPTLMTNYRGFPPPTARIIAALEMLISFSVCGFAIMFFHGLLKRPRSRTLKGHGEQAAVPSIVLRRFLALGMGTVIALSLGGILRRLYLLGSFSYDGTQYGGPQVQKITPNDKFYQVTKNLVDPDVARDVWRLDIVGQVENPRVFSFARHCGHARSRAGDDATLHFLWRWQRIVFECGLERRASSDAARLSEA